MLSLDSKSYEKMSKAIKFVVMDAIEGAKSGHPGMPMGMADVASVLYNDYLKFYPGGPKWYNRDRFILSAGHGSMLLYSLMYLTGYPDITAEDLRNFRQLHAVTSGHPELGLCSGAETTTGPLGQGIANAVGIALSERMMSARFPFVDHRTYVIAGDGCLMEGISHEAASIAGRMKLHKLTVLFDNNNISIDGKVDRVCADDAVKRFESYGWQCIEIDGHDYEAIGNALNMANKSDKPTLISCKTVIAKGSPGKEGHQSSHGAPLGEEEVARIRKEMNWPYAPFDVPDDTLSLWRAAGSRCESEYRQSMDSLENNPAKEEFMSFLNREALMGVGSALRNLKAEIVKSVGAEPTRKSSGRALAAITAAIPNIIGGSADLSESTCAITPSSRAIEASDYSGTYIHYGAREHAMAAIMNGLAIYGGFVPYGSTFLVFSDYCRPVFRLSALMRLQVIYVMTHDSIGLGEDGPTHQPIEHLSSLRSIPGLYVFRPADAVETVESWDAMLQIHKSPSVIVLTRQKVDKITQIDRSDNKVERGFYRVRSLGEGKKVSLFASGSEVSLAIAVANNLNSNYNIGIEVISCPCFELFAEQDEEYRNGITKSGSLNVVIEAGTSLGWHKYVGSDALMFTIEDYGLSAPASDLFEYFGFTVRNIANKIMLRINEQQAS